MSIFAQCFLFIIYSFILIAAIWLVVTSMLKDNAPSAEPVAKLETLGAKNADNSIN